MLHLNQALFVVGGTHTLPSLLWHEADASSLVGHLLLACVMASWHYLLTCGTPFGVLKGSCRVGFDPLMGRVHMLS